MSRRNTILAVAWVLSVYAAVGATLAWQIWPLMDEKSPAFKARATTYVVTQWPIIIARSRDSAQ